MLAVSAYGMSQWMQTPKSQRGNRAFLLAFSGVFAAAGMVRAFWPDPPTAAVDDATAAATPKNFPMSSRLRMGETVVGRGITEFLSDSRVFREKGGGKGGIRKDSSASSCSSIGVVDVKAEEAGWGEGNGREGGSRGAVENSWFARWRP